MSCTPECAAILASHDKERRRALAERDEAVAKVEKLRSALVRTESNFRLAVASKPVRDMAENLAENRAALEGSG